MLKILQEKRLQSVFYQMVPLSKEVSTKFSVRELASISQISWGQLCRVVSVAVEVVSEVVPKLEWEEVGGGMLLPRLSCLPPPPFNTLALPTPQHPAGRQGFGRVDDQLRIFDLVVQGKGGPTRVEVVVRMLFGRLT